MAKYLKPLIPFIIITILAAGAVEIFYRMVLSSHKTTSPELNIQQTAPEIVGTTPADPNNQIDHQVILQRNLFAPPPPKNAPAEKVEVPVVDLAETSLELALLGTITGSSKNRRAIILDKKKKVQDIYFQGDEVQGALIKEIHREKVILTVKGRDEILVPETSSSNNTTPVNPALLYQGPMETTQEAPSDIPKEDIMEPEPIGPVEPVEPVENNTLAPPNTGAITIPENSLP